MTEKELNLPKPITIGEFEMTEKEKKEVEDKLQELIQFEKSLAKKQQNHKV